MGTKNNKPKHTSNELVIKMRDEKGIKFNIINETDAELYLLNVNNYLRTAAYRKNYQKKSKGIYKDKYIDLDFAYLQELSTIDMHLRNIISQMARDIEHSLKVKILKEIESNSNEDGYTIVKDFLDQNNYSVKSIAAMSCSPFTGDLIQNYFKIQSKKDMKTGKLKNKIIDYSSCPIWVFFELITFGELIKFYTFYNYRNNKKGLVSENILNLAKSLRNAASHNNCIIFNLECNTSRAPIELSNRILQITEINKSQRQKKLSTRPTLEFVGLLYCYDKLVSSNVKKHTIDNLKELFFIRMLRNKEYFTRNELIKSTYDFCCKVINGFF